MHSNYLLAVAFFSAHLHALPLNINLGAYSPALVVGDGEISFGGKQDVSNLMNALEGAAVAGGAAAAAQPAAAPAQAAPAAAAVVQPADASTIQSVPLDQSAQVTSLQGMGKEIAPRVVQLHQAAAKRDLQGFNAALNYATGALKTSPEVQLGTGEGGSGVGIIQKAGGTPSATTPRPARRNVVDRDLFSPKMKTTVTTMFVRGGSLPASARSEDSSIEKREPNVAAEKRAPSPSAIDGVNLNMAEGQVAELTFVETREVDEDDEE
ncbi:hypothetical protein ONS95_000386 [Cadophora gregata]|uniref:uncharacterized protein n=1 Tax=Cadophora gregata TaxID=51156 RepID=UPI0026DB707A|nr:uncharacterized protein ONS95_000386 [Cadophora gregata]KAK0125606.1 hypothetical protein ONS96_009441 [Cadophora gregata f. sp. sojae]KAK0128413.1 hypothetical protein ONS95_000386 [Cadophora gregata]